MFKVPLTKVLNVAPHSNADKLDIITVYGFQVIATKGKFKINDLVIYVPVDSILPQAVEDKIFPPDSKVKLNKHRVRQIRLRGLASQGLLVSPDEVNPALGLVDLETDLAEELGITKYEPPQVDNSPNPAQPRKKTVRENPNFHRYGGLDNIKWYPEKFKADELVVLQEKIHGTNARAAVMPWVANTLWKKILQLFGYAPKEEFCWGSNNVQLQNKSGKTGFYGKDITGAVFEKLNVKTKLQFGETVFGEIYGEGIQKNYTYGATEHKFILFDVKVLQPDGTHKWLNPDEVKVFAQERGFDMVPELYRGPFKSLDFAKTYAKGGSVFAPCQKVREGAVVKSLANYDEFGDNRALKIINEDYLADETNTDFH